MDNPSKQDRVYGIFQTISKDYDKANVRISLGMEKGWKRMLVQRLAACSAGSEVLDVCCGTGDIALELAHRRRDLEIIGLDFSPAMLDVAEEKRQGLENVRFQQGNAMKLPFQDDRFAATCISFGLRNTENYAQVLREMQRVTKPGGYVYCLDSFVPENPLIQPFYRFYFRFLMPRLGGKRKHVQEYQWLYESTQAFLRPRALEALFQRIGLNATGSRRKLFGACVLLWGEK